MVEVWHLDGKSEILGGAKAAFVNVVTWASDRAEYKRNVELVIGAMGGLTFSDVINPEPVETRRAKTNGVASSRGSRT
jgi:hypothetical protein